MSGDVSLIYWFFETSHSSSHRYKNYGISDDESLEVSLGDGWCGHRYLETSYVSSRNCGGYHSSDSGIGGSRSQDTIHYFYHYGRVYNFVVDVRGGNKSQ